MLEDIQFHTNDPNVYFDVFNITIKPNLFALIDYALCIRGPSGSSTRYTIKIEGDEYKRWTNDDRYLYIIIASRHDLQYVEKVEPEFIERRYCLPNGDGTFRDIVEMRKNPLYTGLPPIVVTTETIFTSSGN
jgi:hypothetical protein